MSEKNQLQVEAIRHGSVIDHVPAGQGIKILKLFQLIETQERITVGFNLKSGALGKKDLIKIENTRLTEQQANQLALFAPTATVNIIEDFAVVKKHQLKAGKNKFEFIVNEQPAKAGIDPYNMLIDRNPTDNTKTLSEG